MSNTRIQNVLLKQLQRQMRIAELKENQRLHRELRYYVRKYELINDHFDEQRDGIVLSFEKYKNLVMEKIALNKTRFDLNINHKIERILDQDYAIDHEEDIDDVDEVSKRLYADQNSKLFFGSLYPTYNTNKNNMDFYAFLSSLIVFIFIRSY
jgi:hypothetical protein